MSNRTYGHKIHLVDQDKLTAWLQAKARDVHGMDSWESYKAGRMAVVKTVKGTAVLCTEGVGWWIDDDGNLDVEAWHQGWQQWIGVPEQDVLGMVSDETVELADFIRSFGSRLEVNFSVWLNEVARVKQDWSVA